MANCCSARPASGRAESAPTSSAPSRSTSSIPAVRAVSTARSSARVRATTLGRPGIGPSICSSWKSASTGSLKPAATPLRSATSASPRPVAATGRPAIRSSTAEPCRASAKVAGLSPASTTGRPEIRSASALPGLVNTSRAALLRSASASSSSASAARSTSIAGSTAAIVASPAARYRHRPKSSGAHIRGSSTAARPAAASRNGPSNGAMTTTRAPRRTATAAAETRAASPGSSPATTRTSNGPIHGGTCAAHTSGSAAVAPSAPMSMSPALAAGPRPASQITDRGRCPPATDSSAPSSTAAPVARTCAPAVAEARSRPSRSASSSAPASSRSTQVGAGLIRRPHYGPRSPRMPGRGSSRPPRHWAPPRSAAAAARCWRCAG